MKRFCLLYLLIHLEILLVGQSAFYGAYGEFGFDELQNIVECENGDFAASGTTSRLGSDGDLWLIRTNPQGKLLWEKSYGSEFPEFNGVLAIRSGGGFYLAGQTYAPWNDTISLVVYSLDEDGNIIWEKLYGDYYNDPTGIISFPDGRVAITGSQIDSSLVNLGQVFLLVLDSNGTVLIDKSYGGPFTDLGSSFCATPDGGYVLVGVYDSAAIDNDPPIARFYIVRADENGDTIWTKKLRNPAVSSGWSVPRNVCTYGEGRYLATGDMTVCFNDVGEILWTEPYVRGSCILRKSKHSFLVAQQFGLVEVDEHGQMTSLDTYHDFEPSAMIQTSDGGWLLGGFQELTAGAFDGVLVKTNCKGKLVFDPECSAPQMPPQIFPMEVMLIPNHSGQGLLIQTSGLSDNEAWGFRLIDFAGRILLEKEAIIGNQYSISTTNLANAAYIFEWRLGENRVLKRLKYLNFR